MPKQLQNFVSELDQFLQEFDREHTVKSASQQKEINKHSRIAKLRDQEQADKPESTLWSEF